MELVVPETDTNDPQDGRRWPLVAIYAVAMAFWFLHLAWIPSQVGMARVALWGFVPVALGINLALTFAGVHVGSFATEVLRIEEVERHAAHMIAGLLGLFLLAAAVASLQSGDALTPFSGAFVRTGAMSLAWSVGGIMPFYWVPERKPSWLQTLRHLKGIALIYSIGLFLTASFVLLGVLA